MQPGGQSIVDRFLAAKNTIAGQALAKVVCKATTEEMMGPKRKHLDFLVQATNEMNVSIPEVADLLIERAQNSSWVVCLKALITIHHLMYYGNERFEAYMASHNHHLQSAVWVDRMGMPGGGDTTSYIRRYTTYLNEKRDAYKLMGYDFCKIKRGKDDGLLRTMSTEKLLKSLSVLQKQLDAALHFDITANELMNPVINSCFFLLVKDLIRLYAVSNDGVISLLEKYFDMNKKQCREGLDIYKKFLDRTEKVSHYLKLAETSGVEHNEIPDLSRAPSSLLEALENHLAHIEGKKIPSQSIVSRRQTDEDVKNFSRDFIVHDHEESQKVLEEEAKALAQFSKQKETSSPPPPATTMAATQGANLLASKPNSFADDLFSLDAPSTQLETNHFHNIFDTSAAKPNLFDDILQPTFMSTNKTSSTVPLVTNNQNIPHVAKSLQTGDLASSLNHLIENLDMKDRSKIGKDHQWTANESKNQQKIGIGAAMMNTPGTTWMNPSPVNGSSASIPSAPLWQPSTSAVMPSNPFATSNGPSQTNLGGMGYHAPHFTANPFLAQTSYTNTGLNSQQVNNPFGGL